MKKRLRVVVEVLGGVAYVTKKPHGVDVKIIDHDDIESEPCFVCNHGKAHHDGGFCLDYCTCSKYTPQK